MRTSTAWQLGSDAAMRYEEILTPVILGPFAKELVAFAQIEPGACVVDVGCGTGAAARYAATQTTEAGAVIGIDLNPGMIDVAIAISAGDETPLRWRVADATALPLETATVDLVLCAQSLQFMGEKALPALTEMRRVLKAQGRVALSLWSAIEENPYFHSLVKAIDRHLGSETAAGLLSAFRLHQREAVVELFRAAGFGQIEMSVARLDLRLPPLIAWIPRHISATPMAASFIQASVLVQQRIIQDVTTDLAAYHHGGQVVVPFQSHMILGCIYTAVEMETEVF